MRAESGRPFGRRAPFSLTMKPLTVNANPPARPAAGDDPWRATGLEPPVFADPSGRRALTMSGIGLAMAAATLAALVIVVTAAVGFTSIPRLLPLPVPRVLTARSSATSRRVDHRFAAVVRGQAGGVGRVSDAVADRRSRA